MRLAAAYKQNGERRTQQIDVLRILWLGRFATYVAETTGINTTEAERELEKQAAICVQERDYLISLSLLKLERGREHPRGTRSPLHSNIPGRT